MTVDHLPLFRTMWDGDELVGFMPCCPCGWTAELYEVAEFGEEAAEAKAQRTAGRHVMLETSKARVRAQRARRNQRKGAAHNACLNATEEGPAAEGRRPQVDTEGQDVESGEPDQGSGAAVL